MIARSEPKHVVWIPFNRTDNVEHYQSKLCHVSWWKKRADILRRFTFPSLANQTFDDFDIWVSILKRYEELSKPVQRVCKEAQQKYFGGRLHVLIAKWPRYSTPREPHHWLLRYKRPIVAVHLDSDDMLHREALASVAQVPFQHGQVILFRNGWVFDMIHHRLAEYRARGGAPPFYAMCFGKKALASPHRWVTERKDAGFNVPHSQLVKCKKRACVRDGLYCYVIHEANLALGWNDRHTRPHVGRLIDESSDQVRILEAFGLSPLFVWPLNSKGWWEEKIKRYHSIRIQHVDFVAAATELRGSSIAEIGCCFGDFSKYVPSDKEYFGIDISSQAIQLARMRYPNVRFYLGDFREIMKHTPGPDTAVALQVIEHFSNPRAILRSLLAWSRRSAVFSVPRGLPKHSDLVNNGHLVGWRDEQDIQKLCEGLGKLTFWKGASHHLCATLERESGLASI